MELKCRRCGQVIKPDEQMVIVSLGRPSRWNDPELVARRLAFSPGRWHYRCVPKPVRKYVGAVST